jgi:hypothetical protein
MAFERPKGFAHALELARIGIASDLGAATGRPTWLQKLEGAPNMFQF